MSKYKIIYTEGESMANFENKEHPELFDTPQKAFQCADNLYPANKFIRVVEEIHGDDNCEGVKNEQ